MADKPKLQFSIPFTGAAPTFIAAKTGQWPITKLINTSRFPWHIPLTVANGWRDGIGEWKTALNLEANGHPDKELFSNTQHFPNPDDGLLVEMFPFVIEVTGPQTLWLSILLQGELVIRYPIEVLANRQP